MSYEKQIAYNDYIIEFEYSYVPALNTLVLNKWTAFIGPTEIELPCAVESSYIESKLQGLVDMEWAEKGSNYIEDYLESVAEKKYNFLEDK